MRFYVKTGMIYPIEIKKGISIGKRAGKNFGVLEKYGIDIKLGLIIDSCEKISPLNENTFFYPTFRIGE